MTTIAWDLSDQFVRAREIAAQAEEVAVLAAARGDHVRAAAWRAPVTEAEAREGYDSRALVEAICRAAPRGARVLWSFRRPGQDWCYYDPFPVLAWWVEGRRVGIVLPDPIALMLRREPGAVPDECVASAMDVDLSAAAPLPFLGRRFIPDLRAGWA